MLPFGKYEFSGSFQLNQTMRSHSLVENLEETFGIMKIMRGALISQIIDSCHYEPVYQFLATSILVSIEDPIDSELSETTLLKLLK